MVDENLERFYLLWLDASVNDSAENVDAQAQLRASINYLKTFEDDEQCEQYIRSVSSDDRIVFIVSGRLGRVIVPRIHSLRQLGSIYVYCKDKKLNEPWAREFKKVKGVIVLLDELISQIRSDQGRRRRKNDSEPILINLKGATIGHEQSTSNLDGQYIHSQLLMDCLLRMKPTTSDKSELVGRCQQFYQKNEFELAILTEFEKHYAPDRALWWYTREAFVYRLMNKALRTLNVDLLVLFGFFFRDLEEQLKQRRCSSPVHLYRGQLMSREEIQILKDSVGQCIAMNSYFSTSINRSNALSFLDYSSDLDQVLFEIEADPRIIGIKPFANITSHSYYPEEEEVLFQMGSIFKLLSVEQDKDELWTIRIVLASNEQHDSHSIINQMKQEQMDSEASLLTYGDLARQLGRLDAAEKCYHRYLNESSANSRNIADCYYSMALVAAAKGNYTASLQLHQDALSLKLENLKSNDPKIATSYNSIAVVYRKQEAYQQALDFYEKALKIWRQALAKKHPKVAKCLSNMGTVYECQENFSRALQCYQDALEIAEASSTIDYLALSATHNNLGNIHYQLSQYQLALEHYQKALAMKLKIFPGHHPSIGSVYQNIARLYEAMGDTRRASSYAERAAEIARHT